MAPIDVVQAQSEAAARRQLLALAVETQRTSELVLKELIVGGTSDALWNAELNPTDQPRIEATPIDLEGAIRMALDRRTDVSRARRQLDANEATADNLRNSTLPALDLVGSYQLTGQGGPRRVPAGNSFADLFGGAGGVIPGGYGDALQSVANADYPVWRVQLQMTYPLGQSADRAAYERARLELQQNRAQIRRIELRIASEVTNAALRIESIRDRIDAATASRELAERQLEAEESKFEVGLSTNFSSCSRNAISPPRRMPSCARFSTTNGRESSSSGRSALRSAEPASPWSAARRPAALRGAQAPHRRGRC